MCWEELKESLTMGNGFMLVKEDGDSFNELL